MIALIFALFIWAAPVYAHPLDTAFFDFEQTASGTTLTVAMQPPEAFEVVRLPKDNEWNLERFRERGDMLAAFVGERVQLSRAGQACDWDPLIGPVASSTFDALADGITVAGLIDCPVSTGPFTLASDLFTDRFPGQENLVRIVQAGDFRELFSLTSSTGSATIDVDALAAPSAGLQASQDVTSSNNTLTSAQPVSKVTPILVALGFVALFGLTQMRRWRFGRGSTDR